MKDRWINAGHEEDELKPFVEPELDISDQKRIGILVLSRMFSICRLSNKYFMIHCIIRLCFGTRFECLGSLKHIPYLLKSKTRFFPSIFNVEGSGGTGLGFE